MNNEKVKTYEDNLIYAMESLVELLRFRKKMLSKDQRKLGRISAGDAMRVVTWVKYWQNEITRAANAIKQAEEKAKKAKPEPTKEEK